MGNVYIILQQIYSGKSVPKFYRNRLSFIEDSTKRTFWSLFSGHAVFSCLLLLYSRKYHVIAATKQGAFITLY